MFKSPSPGIEFTAQGYDGGTTVYVLGQTAKGTHFIGIAKWNSGPAYTSIWTPCRDGDGWDKDAASLLNSLDF